jgi:hypothetical protein
MVVTGFLFAAAPSVAAAQEKKEAPPAAKAAPTAKVEAPAPAVAEKPASAESLAGTAAKSKNKGPAKPQKIDFEDEMIRGTLTRPEGDFIGSGKSGPQRSLIKIRKHFVPELLKSADDL